MSDHWAHDNIFLVAKKWPLRSVVRTSGFRPEKNSSILLWGTNGKYATYHYATGSNYLVEVYSPVVKTLPIKGWRHKFES